MWEITKTLSCRESKWEVKCMITVFNRKELIITMEMKRQAEVRDIL